MKRSALIAACALVLVIAPSASGKGGITLTVAQRSASVGQPVTFVLSSTWKPPYNLRVFAVAPGKNWFSVVGTLTGDCCGDAVTPHDGFQVRVVRIGPKRWRGVVKFPRPGRWQLVEPCGCESGISTRQATAFVTVR